MNSILYFLLGCIPIRIFLALIPLMLDKTLLLYFGLILLSMSIGFLVLYFGNYRLEAPEASGKTWWANLRIIHGLLFLAAAIYCFKGESLAWIPLAIDVTLGFFAFIYHHYLS